MRIAARNVLLVGNAGKGKSTLANVLTESNEFKESADRINGNDEAKSKEFKHDELKYRIIDTVGFGIFNKQTEEILNKLEDKSDVLSEGLNQILFVTSGRFTKEEAEHFDLIRNAIFDDHATYYTTIVCTNFPSFEDKRICERNRQEFRKEIEKFSKSLASTTIIYVDNPPLEGRYKSMAGDSRRASREILLDHLKTCQKVYQPETLGKFRKMVDEFNSIIKDTIEAVNNAELHCIDNVNFVGEFIYERKEIIEKVEKSREEVKKCMEDRSKSSIMSHSALLLGKGLALSGTFLFPPILVPGIAISVIGLLGATSSDSVAILKESESYRLFEESLLKDNERCETLESLQRKLEESVNEFKEIRPRFKDSEYKERNIDRKKIEIIKEVIDQILGEEVETDMKLEKNKKTERSTGIKAARATLETLCKLVPSPLSFYCMYRDHKEAEERDSLGDMKTIIENLCQELKVIEEIQQLLFKLYEKICLCKEEIAKL